MARPASPVLSLLPFLQPIFSVDKQLAADFINLVDVVLCGVLLFTLVALSMGVKTPYGRYSSNSWGPTIPGIIDWVAHGSALIAVHYCLRQDDFGPLSTGSALMLTLYVIHYTWRSFIFGFTVKKPKPIPFFIMVFGSSFCFFNSLCIARELTLLSPIESVASIRFVAGLGLFLFGFLGNAYHDQLLIALRKTPGEGYQIPRGGLFEYISGANFFCEICEWFGFAICTGCNSAWAFAFCTACNIGPRAVQHHSGYLEMFGEKYPKHRKALIPFVL